MDNDIEWVEQPAFENSPFRIWHVMFMAFSTFLAFVILICCCVKIRIPRTKQEIEADYQRKKIAKKFRERLRLIQNQDMDNLSLKSALERVRKDFNKDKNLDSISEIESNSSVKEPMKAEPQQPVDKKSFGKRISNAMLFTKIKKQDDQEKINVC